MAREVDLERMRVTHDAALAAGHADQAGAVRAKTRAACAKHGLDVPAWAAQRAPTPIKRPPPTPAAPAAPVVVPGWLSAWRAASSARSFRINSDGILLIEYRDGERWQARVHVDEFRTENCARYALASGEIVFRPQRPVAEGPKGWKAHRPRLCEPKTPDPGLAGSL